MKRIGRVKESLLALGSHLSSDQTGYVSPLRLFLILIASIFVAEIVAMILVYFIGPIPYFLTTLIDAGIMVVLICPVLYLFSFRPLIQHIESLRQSEQKVKLEQKRLESILATMPYGIYIVNQQYDVEYVNPVIEREFGPVAGQKCYAYLHEQNEVCAWCKNSMVFEGKSTQWQWSSSRTGKIYEAFETPFINSDGSLSKLKIIHDITERKHSEEMVRMLSGVVEQTADTVVITDCEGVIQYVNPAFEQLTGYTKEETLGQNPRVIKSGFHDEQFYRTLWDTVLNGQVFHGEIANRKKNGEVFHEVKTITPLRNEHGEITRFVATGKDITEHKLAEQKLYQAYAELEVRIQERTQELRYANSELEDEIRIRRQAEDALQQSEQHLKRAQEIAHLGSWELDLLTGQLTWSDEVYRIFGLQPQEFGATYEAFLEAIHPDDRESVNDAYLSSIRDGRDMYEIEHRVVKKTTGEVRSVHEKCEHFRNDAGEIVRSVGMVHDITERKKAEQQLQYQATLLANVNDAIVASDAQFRLTAWNSEAETLYGWKADEVLGLNGIDVIRTEWPKADADEMRRVIANTGRWRGEAIQQRKDGTRFPVEVSSIVLRDAYGQVTGYVSVNRDITERKRIEEQLERSNQKLNEILASIQDDFYVLDRNWTFIYANRLFTKKVGKEPEDFVGNNIWTMFPKHVGTILEENFRTAMENREVRRFELGGKYTNAWYRMTVFPSAEGITVIGTDITEIKKAEEALRESEEKFRSAFADANIGFAMTTPQGRFQEVNPAYCQLTGYDLDELLAMDFQVLIHPEDRETNLMLIDQMLRGELADFLIENRYIRKDNRAVWVRKSISLVRSMDGKPQWIIALTEDITERKQAEDALRLSRENFSKAFQSSPAALLITRLADGQFMELNDAYSRIIGYERAELLGHRTTEFNIFVNEKDRKEIVDRLLAKGSIRNFETGIRHKSGVIRFVVAAQELITFDDEACILTSLEDITELKEAEKILQRTNRILRAHSASNQAMLHAANETELLNEVCKIVVEDCGHAMVWVGYADDNEEKSVRPVAHSGFDKGYLESLRITWADTERGRGPTGTAIRTGKPQSCRNMLTDPLFAPWRKQALDRGYASSIVLPLVTKSGVLGAMTIYSREPDAFAPDEADLLNELALDLTQGIEMIRLRDAHERTTAALRESEERFRLALSHAPVTVAVQDRDLHYTWAYNQRTRSRDEIIGKTDTDLFPDEAEYLTALKLRVFETGENASEQLWLNSNNSRVFLDLFMEPLKNEKGEIVGIGLASVDLTALKLAEEELRLAHDELELRVQERTAELAAANLELSREIAERREIERQLRIQTAAMEAAANGIIITDPKGTMLWSNPAMTEISGYARDELVGHSTRLFNSGRNEPEFYPKMWETILAGNVWRGETTNRRKDGSLYIEEQTITPVRNDAGRLSHFIAIKQDITERKLIYAQLEASNQELITLTNLERQQRFLAEGLVESSMVLNMSLELHAVLDRIFEQTRRIIPYLAADIVLIDGDVATLVQQWWTDEHSDAKIVSGNESLKIQEFPIWERISTTKSAVMVPDTQLEERWNTYFGMKWIRSYLGAPLIYNDQIIGIINLISDRENAFQEDMVKALRAFAAPAAVAIQNARLYENEQQNRKIAEILSAATVALAQTLDTQMVIETILDYVQSVMRFDVAYVVLSEGEERYRIRAARTDDNHLALRDYLLDQTIDMLSEPILRSYFTKHESTYIPDARELAVWNPPVRLVPMNCWLGIPLESMGKVLGIVVIAHGTPHAFTRNQIQLVEAVVKQAVVALQNAWLFEQVRSGRERLQQLSRHLVDVQENERKYIARELHDETSQSLTSLKMGLQVIEKEAERRVRLTEQVRNLQALADETLESLHHLAVNLRPASLDHLGLVDALTSLVESTRQRSSLQAHFKIIGSMPMADLTEEIETSIYRIVQESITNVVRHAHATYVDVILEWQEEKILIVIEDDGVGMDMQKARETGRLGLIGMQERAEMLGGRMLVDSTPQVGTTLVVEIPYANSNPYSR